MGKKVLLIDDAFAFHDLEKKLFRRTRCTFESAHTEDEAIEKAEKEKPDIILLYMDVPGQYSGVNVCARLKKNFSVNTIPLILVGSQANAMTADSCRALKADDFLNLPVQESELLSKVSRHLKIPVRQAVRILVRLEISGRNQKEVFFGVSENISKTGMYIDTERELNIDDIVFLRFYLIEHEEVATDAQIVRKEATRNGYGYGVRFKDLGLPQQMAINRFIEARKR